jgi:hypothetical protein
MDDTPSVRFGQQGGAFHAPAGIGGGHLLVRGADDGVFS